MASVSLTRHLRDCAAQPFDWGRLNCWLFVADWIALATGNDPAADLRGVFGNRFGCLRALTRRGARSYLEIADMLAVHAGLHAIDPHAMHRGDVAALPTPRGHIGLICTGERFAAKIGPGLWWSAVDRSNIARAWALNA